MLQNIYDFIKGLCEGLGGYLGNWVPQASSYASDIDALIGLVAILAGFWFIVAELVFFGLIFKFRAKPGKRPDRVRGPLHVGIEIKPLVRAPGMPGQNFGRLQQDMVGEVGAGIGEQLVEHPAHGEDGRPGVHPDAGDLDLPHFPARRRGALHDVHGQAAGRQVERGGQTRDACPDDNNTVRGHRPKPFERLSLTRR